MYIFSEREKYMFIYLKMTIVGLHTVGYSLTWMFYYFRTTENFVLKNIAKLI